MMKTLIKTVTSISIMVAVFHHPSLGQISVMLTPSEDISAPLNPNSSVDRNCTLMGTSLFQWKVNNIAFAESSAIGGGVTIVGPPLNIGPGVYRSTIRIPFDMVNDNITIMCVGVDPITRLPTNSNSVLVRIQGLLGAPPNTVISESNDGLTRTLSWDAPSTLLDIESYQVCSNLADDLTCVSVNSSEKRELTFSNVAVPLLFTVTAANVVGQGNASSVVHQACEGAYMYDVISI